MSEYKAPLDDIRFLLKEVFQMEQFWQELGNPGEVDGGLADAILEGAAKISEHVLAPLNREGDEAGCHFHAGAVTAPPGFKEAYQAFCDGGWNGLGGNTEYEGMGLPKTLVAPVEEMVQGACMAFGLAPMLTAGAAFCINAHANAELKSRYLPKMYSGEWSGAMDLTEPHAGTDLGLIKTKAEPRTDGSYSIKGSKIFITWGEHDLAANIIHLVLAKLPDAPSGSRGISLFLVPKFIPDENNQADKPNAFSCGSIEHKMGIHGSATCVMNYDGAQGWMVGEPNKGLSAMFTMMNYERLLVGIEGVGVAESSYQNALQYARERLQSRSPLGPQVPEKPADPLIVHPDIRRMLMTMKCLNEAGRAFYIYVAKFLDTAKFSSDAEQTKMAEGMVALLTPIAKAFLTDMSLDSTIHGQQVFGGHGYIREWGQEQHVRDVRITQIYEGTNGIQAMDLIGRKTVACKGELLELFVRDVENFIDSVQVESADELIQPLKNALIALQSSTQEVVANAAKDARNPGAVAVDYLHLFGYVAYAYMWLRMVVAATDTATDQGSDFVAGKVHAARFYFAYMLPQIATLEKRIGNSASLVMDLDAGVF